MISEVSDELSSLRNSYPCLGPAFRATRTVQAAAGAVDPAPCPELVRIPYARISPTLGIYSGRWYIGVAWYSVGSGTPAS